jgi:RNA polymerase sigma factor (sigma-70 family)
LDFIETLSRTLGLSCVFEAADPIVFSRSEWLTIDDTIVRALAYSKSRRHFWRNVAALGTDADDSTLIHAANRALRGEYEDMELLRLIRHEAKEIASDRGIMPSIHVPATDILALSPEEREAYYTKMRAQHALAAPKKFFGDDLYGIYDSAGKQIRGGFATEAEAQLYQTANLPAGIYIIRKYENPKSLSKLKETRFPLKHGWAEDEVVQAFMPVIRKLAWKYHNLKAPYEDLMQHGAIGVLNALKTDIGDAPIWHHAWRHILGEVRRAALTGGIIRGGEHLKGAAGFAQMGGLLGYDVNWPGITGMAQTKFFPSSPKAFEKHYAGITGRSPPRTMDPAFREAQAFATHLTREEGVSEDEIEIRERRSGMTSADVPMGKGEERPTTLAATLRATRTHRPEYIAQQRELLALMMDKAKLTEHEKQIITLYYGLDEPAARLGAMPPPGAEKPGRPPEKISAARTVTRGAEKEGAVERGPAEIARILGVSERAVRVGRDKALLKLLKASGEYSTELQKKGLIKKPEELAATESLIRNVALFESHFRNHVIYLLITGSINGLCSDIDY